MGIFMKAIFHVYICSRN